MRKYLLAAVAAAAVSSPAIARDGQPYVGIEGGLLFPKDQSGDIFADFTTTQTVPTTPTVVGPTDTEYDDAYSLDYDRGRDLDIIAGYDFGMFRLEGELAFKRAGLNEFDIDSGDIAALNLALNRPSGVGDPGAPGLPALTSGDIDLDGRVKVRSIMLNALLDFGDEDGLSFYGGVGAGRARVRFAGDSDNAWAFQGIAGVRYALSKNIDLGLKYRYFRTGKVDLVSGTEFVDGNPDTVIVGTAVPVTTIVTTDAALTTDFEQKFRSHSLLASLIFNFGGEKAPPPPPPYVAPPPPPPPATQTCPDGSVILASDMCPPAPEPYVPPPPPPEPAPERG